MFEEEDDLAPWEKELVANSKSLSQRRTISPWTENITRYPLNGTIMTVKIPETVLGGERAEMIVRPYGAVKGATNEAINPIFKGYVGQVSVYSSREFLGEGHLGHLIAPSPGDLARIIVWDERKDLSNGNWFNAKILRTLDYQKSIQPEGDQSEKFADVNPRDKRKQALVRPADLDLMFQAAILEHYGVGEGFEYTPESRDEIIFNDLNSLRALDPTTLIRTYAEFKDLIGKPLAGYTPKSSFEYFGGKTPSIDENVERELFRKFPPEKVISPEENSK